MSRFVACDGHGELFMGGMLTAPWSVPDFNGGVEDEGV